MKVLIPGYEKTSWASSDIWLNLTAALRQQRWAIPNGPGSDSDSDSTLAFWFRLRFRLHFKIFTWLRFRFRFQFRLRFQYGEKSWFRFRFRLQIGKIWIRFRLRFRSRNRPSLFVRHFRNSSDISVWRHRRISRSLILYYTMYTITASSLVKENPG